VGDVYALLAAEDFEDVTPAQEIVLKPFSIWEFVVEGGHSYWSLRICV
jgi:hypothetical protein